MASYDIELNIININNQQRLNPKTFMMTLLHEVNHAIEVRKMGKMNFMKYYNNESKIQYMHGNDPYWDNKYEIQAENFAREEIKYWLTNFNITNLT